MPQKNIQFLAYYLPQYHPIPENDEWWGKGFTEWTNVAKAKPLFKGHYQPILPADLGFYDLRVPEVQQAQAKLAQEYGIDGFIYYQYWFGNGKKLLEKPAENMLKNKKVDFPFCFCWANETWKGIWHGLDNPNVLIEQTYQGESGYVEYFNYLLPFFNDERYIKVDNKPMFHVYKLQDIPDLELFIEKFNKMATIIKNDTATIKLTLNVANVENFLAALRDLGFPIQIDLPKRNDKPQAKKNSTVNRQSKNTELTEEERYWEKRQAEGQALLAQMAQIQDDSVPELSEEDMMELINSEIKAYRAEKRAQLEKSH